MPLILVRSPMNMFYTEIMGDIDPNILRAIRLKEGWNEQDWNFVVTLKRSNRHITTINLMIPDVLTIICSDFEYKMAQSTIYLSHPEGEHFLLYILQKMANPLDTQPEIDEEEARIDISTETTSLYDETYKNKATMTEYDKRFYTESHPFRERSLLKMRSEMPELANLLRQEEIDEKEKSQDKKDEAQQDQEMGQREEKEAPPTSSKEVKDEKIPSQEDKASTEITQGTSPKGPLIVSGTPKSTEGTLNAQVEPYLETKSDKVKIVDESVEPEPASESKPIEEESEGGKVSKKSRRKSKKLEKQNVKSDKTGLAKKSQLPESETPTPIMKKDDGSVPFESTEEKKAKVAQPTETQKKAKSEIKKSKTKITGASTTQRDESKPLRVIYKEASTQIEDVKMPKSVQRAEASTSTHRKDKIDASTDTERHYVQPITIMLQPSSGEKISHLNTSGHKRGVTEQSHYLENVENSTPPVSEDVINIPQPVLLSMENLAISTSSETDVETVKERSLTLMIVEESGIQSEDEIEKSHSLPEIIERTIQPSETSRLQKTEPSNSIQKEVTIPGRKEISTARTQQPKFAIQSTYPEFPDAKQLTQLPLESMEGETDPFDSSLLRRRRLIRRRRKYNVKEVIDRLGSSHTGSIMFKRKHSTSGSSEDAKQEDPRVAYVVAEPPSKSIFDYVIDLPRKISEKLLSFLSGSPSQTEQQMVSSSVSPRESEPVPSTSKVDDSVEINLEPSTTQSEYTFLHPPTELPFKVSKVPKRKSSSTPSINQDLYKAKKLKEIPSQTSRKFGVLELIKCDPTATTSVHVERERETTSRESRSSSESLHIERELSVMAIHGSESSEYEKPSTSSSNYN